MGKVPQPNIIWRGAHPNNFTVGRPGASRDGRNSFHHVVGSAESAVLVFNNPTRGASSHFIVTDQPGVIFQCVSLDNTAWTDGNWESNIRSVTVEHHGDWRNGYDNPTVRENAAMLAAWLRDNGFVNHPIRHRQVSTVGTQCPADLPVESIWNRATDIINSYNAPVDQRPQWLKDRQDVGDFTVYAQIDGLRLYNLNDPSKFADDRVFAKNQNFLISSYVDVAGKRYLITKSSTDTNAAIGILESQTARTPWTPPVVVEPPKPTTPEWADSVIDDENKTMYVLRATVLVDLENGHPVMKDGREVWYQAGDIIENISAHTIVNSVTYQLTEYSFAQVGAGKWQNANGIKSSDLTLDPKACHPGTPANPELPDEPEDPVDPMPDVPTETENRLSALEKIVKAITDFLDKLFKNWRG